MTNEALLLESFSALGIQLSPEQVNQYLTYKSLLLEWNEKMNLTAITDDEGILLKHFADSVSILSAIELWEGAKVIDVGTGAGFPGLPVKLAKPSVHMTLLDSLKKRLTFLEEVISTLQLENVTCIHSRAEEGGQDPSLREQFDFCISRAVAPLNLLAEYCLPFVKEGGFFLSLKGPQAKEEILQGEHALSILGGEVVGVKEVDIPFTDLAHTLVMIKKIRQTPSQYPRKAGKAAKKPL